MAKGDTLPPSLAPRGLSRVLAAVYIGVSPATFDAMVKAGTMPAPRRIGARVVWDRLEVDDAFTALPRADEAPASNPWDEVTA
jgi:predicted DNA-binding transcriptional regulator AlpA